MIAKALEAGRSLLTTAEALAVLDAFHIPHPPTLLARTADEAVAAAGRIGLPVALKIDADNLIHKSDIDGVVLNLNTLEQVAEAATAMLANARQRLPKDSVHGIVVQKMHGKRHGRELMLGVARDAVFGPTIAFGSGGLSVDVFEDVAVTLPPLKRYDCRQSDPPHQGGARAGRLPQPPGRRHGSRARCAAGGYRKWFANCPRWWSWT